jgi:hypothetical protein
VRGGRVVALYGLHVRAHEQHGGHLVVMFVVVPT